MIFEGLHMNDEQDGLEEYEQARRAIEQNEVRYASTDSLPICVPTLQNLDKKRSREKNVFVFAQMCSIIFFAEVGDKAQLNTIMLATREVQ